MFATNELQAQISQKQNPAADVVDILPVQTYANSLRKVGGLKRSCFLLQRGQRVAASLVPEVTLRPFSQLTAVPLRTESVSGSHPQCLVVTAVPQG